MSSILEVISDNPQLSPVSVLETFIGDEITAHLENVVKRYVVLGLSNQPVRHLFVQEESMEDFYRKRFNKRLTRTELPAFEVAGLNENYKLYLPIDICSDGDALFYTQFEDRVADNQVVPS